MIKHAGASIDVEPDAENRRFYGPESSNSANALLEHVRQTGLSSVIILLLFDSSFYLVSLSRPLPFFSCKCFRDSVRCHIEGGCGCQCEPEQCVNPYGTYAFDHSRIKHSRKAIIAKLKEAESLLG